MVSHELRTPLTIITGAVHTAMLEGLPPEELPALLQEAISGAESLADILDNLLELSRYQANRLSLSFAQTKIRQVLDNVVMQLKGKSTIHQLIVDIPEQLPLVSADRIRLERIMHNLIENAMKYSPKGGEVKIVARHDGSSLTVSVSDQGIGISPESQLRLFQPFQRLSDHFGIKGLGLGLSVCQRLVEDHAGRIWVESQLGKGSTFYFSIPMNSDRISTN
jgi:signal transduction histidine kinase